MLRAQQWQRKSENVWRLSSELGDGGGQTSFILALNPGSPSGFFLAARQNPDGEPGFEANFILATRADTVTLMNTLMVH